MGLLENTMSRRVFLMASGTAGVAALVGGSSLLSGCSAPSSSGGEGAVYTFTVISGAVLIESDPSTGRYKYKKKCRVCGWEEMFSSTETGTGVSEEFKCPQCGNVQEVNIVVSRSDEQGIVSDTETLVNLMYAVNGETQANAKYLVFADVAESEGFKEIAVIIRAISSAELQHADDEFSIAQGYGAVSKPQPEPVTHGDTRQNLLTAIEGETEEYTVMYPEFLEIAEKESMHDAVRLFTYAMKAEEVHAGIYKDLLESIEQIDSEKYANIYRCPVCGNIELTSRPTTCSICGIDGKHFIEYSPFAH